MSYRLISSAAVIILLGACATTQENPYYQQSTQYKGDTAQQTTSYPAVQTASYETASAPAPIVIVQEMPANTQTASHQAVSQIYVPVSTGNQGQPVYTKAPVQTVYASAQTQPAYSDFVQASAETSTPAPTDQHYGETFGTPGYHAMIAAQAAELAEQEALMAGRAADTYSYPQTVAARSEITSTSPVFSAGDSLHEVVEGNTVYSLSRSRCVSVDDIQRLNQLDGNYSIRLGDQIRLPASRC